MTISKATGHNYGNVRKEGINKGAIVRVCRSGLVIPYIESVTKKAEYFVHPEQCPSCGECTEVESDNLICPNTETCPAQIEGTIEFFFKTLGNCDGFGPKVIEQLVSSGEKTVRSIYAMTKLDFSRSGFGGKTCDNLFDELQASRVRPIEDWRFLAAFSIHNVGKGGCERLLKHHRLNDVFNLSINDIVAIDGFAETTANILAKSLDRIKPQLDALMVIGFNLIQTPLASEKGVSSPVSGKTLVFTGTMTKGNRTEMEKQAKSLGATVGSSVSSKTHYLVCGSNVGANKTAAAKKHGVKLLTEQEYMDLVA